MSNNGIMESLKNTTVKWKMVEDIFTLRNGYTPSKAKSQYWTNGDIPWFRMEDLRNNGNILNKAIQYVHKSGIKGKLFSANSIIMTTTATIGEHALITVDYMSNQQFTNFTIKNKYHELLDIKFVYYYFFILGNKAKESINMSSFPSVQMGQLKKWAFPIPSLSIQTKIVRILDAFTELTNELTNELTARKKQYNYYLNQLLSFKEDEVEWKALGDVTKYEQPNKYLVKSKDYNDECCVPVLTAGKTFILGYTDEINGIYKASENPVIIFDDFTTANKWVDFDFKAKSSAMKMITSSDQDKVLLKYIFYWLNTLSKKSVDGDHKRQWISHFSNKKIPIPPFHIQTEIVRILDKFDILTQSIDKGLPREIELRQKQYEYYRNLLLSFPKPKGVAE